MFVIVTILLGHTQCWGSETGVTNTGKSSEDMTFEPYLEYEHLVLM